MGKKKNLLETRTTSSATACKARVSRVSERILTSHISATRGLLATDLVILNPGQVTRMTPELELPSPNYHTTPMGGPLNSRQI
ncbi:hypothetical protein TNCV_4459801 [Trichonephila clavipes]|nr:hypothetical protein TNCV_4459801 [Trichonephila clavipes]